MLSLASGSYPGTQSLTITDLVAGATIYYTTDGTVPTLNSAVYSAPVTIAASEMVTATAIANGYSMSSAVNGQYWIGSSQSRFIYTVAGTGYYAFTGDGGPATQAGLNNAAALAFDAAGNLYIADTLNSAVRKVAAGTGVITTVAGNGAPGYSGDNGLAVNAQLQRPNGLAFDANGNLYISDSGANVVREIAAGTGIITTVAGNGTQGSTGNNGPAISAELNVPLGLAVDANGNLYIGTYGAIREVAAGTGTITTYAGNGTIGYSGDNGPATRATIGTPAALAFDAKGDLYFVDSQEDVVREIAAGTQVITTVAGKGPRSYGSAFSGDGGPATGAQLNSPNGLAVDSTGNLYIADTDNYALREVTAADGIIQTIAGGPTSLSKQGGDGGPATSAYFSFVDCVAIDKSGNLYIADSWLNRIRKITLPVNPPSGTTAAPTFKIAAGTYATAQTVTISDTTPGAGIDLVINGTAVTTNSEGYHGPLSVSGSATFQAIAVAPGYLPSAPVTAAYTITTPPNSLISTVAGSGVFGSSGNGGPAAQMEFEELDGLAVDSSANLYAVDRNAGLVWEINHATGVASIVAGDGSYSLTNLGDGGPATSAGLYGPTHVAVDHAGNLYIADTYNNRVRMVSAQTGTITTYAGGGSYSSTYGDGGLATAAYLWGPEGLAFDAAGNLYIADSGDHRIRKVAAATGIITTVAGGGTQGLGDGGPATSAVLSSPQDVAFDTTGNLYILDAFTERVRMVAASTGIITTVAGNGDAGFAGDGGPATSAQIMPEGIAVDGSGNLYISNWQEIRMVPAGGGNITTVVGTGYPGFEGDGGAAAMAEFGAMGIAFDKSGNLYIADESNGRIREVTYPDPAASPVFSLAAGTYGGTQTLTITDSISGASIYYTTDGTTPTTASTLYTGPVSIGSSETVSAIAVASGYAESATTLAAYTILAAPTITWPAPAAITYGTALSGTQLDATASVPGTFVYSPAAGTVLNAGQQTLRVTFTPDDTNHYATASGSVSLTVNNPQPIISGLSPAFTGMGSSGFTLTVTGSGFIPASTIYWGTTALSTQYVSVTQLSAQVPASDIAVSGTTAITAQNSSPGGGASSAFEFEVDSATSGSIAPPSFTTETVSVTPGSTATYPVTLPTSATNVSVTCLNLPTGATCSYSSTAGTLTIATASTTPAGTYQITVVFTETLPAAATALIFLPILLLPLVWKRRSWAAGSAWVLVCAAIVLTTAMLTAGCGGGSGGGGGSTGPQTHTVTSSANVTLTVQ